MTIFDRPSSSELLKAVIDFVDAETRSDDYPANKRFKLQIVSNVLNIVKREIDLGKKINDDFIPSWPIAIPSVTVIVQNSLGVPPLLLTPFLTDCACLIKAILHGAASFHVETTPTKGLATSFSVKSIE